MGLLAIGRISDAPFLIKKGSRRAAAFILFHSAGHSIWPRSLASLRSRYVFVRTSACKSLVGTPAKSVAAVHDTVRYPRMARTLFLCHKYKPLNNLLNSYIGVASEVKMFRKVSQHFLGYFS